jgi:hypothetical protein
MKRMYFLLLLAVMSCAGPEYDTKYYKAISLDKRDTALLKLLTSEGAFYGDYQINYGDKTQDHGSITGHVIGDTLLGKFSYLSRDNVKSIDPIAFLKTNKNIKLGSGIAGSFMGFHVYQSGSISFNDSLFQFQAIALEEFNWKNPTP